MVRLLIVLIASCVSCFGIAQSISPEVVSAGGGDSSNANARLSWTVGEPVVETVVGSNAQITQGFHQSHFEIISVEEHKELGFDILVYPNPATDAVKVEMNYTGDLPAPQDTEFNLVLTDLAGKLLITENIKNTNEHIIPMQDYATGQYLLQITGIDGGLHKSVQIIKLK